MEQKQEIKNHLNVRSVLIECLPLIKEYSELRYSQSESMKGDIRNSLRIKGSIAYDVYEKAKLLLDEFLSPPKLIDPSLEDRTKEKCKFCGEYLK